MIESSWLKEWEVIFRRKEAAKSVLAVLQAKFGALPPDLPNRLESIEDLRVVEGLVPQAALAGNLDEFRKQIPNGVVPKP